MRIGFLFNHDQIHQIAHSLPIAMELSRGDGLAEIVIATTNPTITAEVLRLGGGEIGRSLRLVELGLKTPRRLLATALDPVAPAAKLLIYGEHLAFFRSLDILVVAEQTSLILKTHYGLHDLAIIYTGHGAGDRAIGFHKAIRLFDHVLVSGPKLRDRMVRESGVDPTRISVVGYPKFDLTPRGGAAFARSTGRPMVLYNPHVSPHLSSWYRDGRKVLDWFAAQDAYALIFAPHVMLFQRPYVLTIDRLRVDSAGAIAPRHWNAANIHIDLGSSRSTDMTYTAQADIYLGDASSQVYEFLRRPRPCVFLNSHHVPWRGDINYDHWRSGPVIETVDGLRDALAAARDDHADVHKPIQEALFDYTFDLSREPSARRAARVIARLASPEERVCGMTGVAKITHARPRAHDAMRWR